jgi:hypothetical protein
MARGDQRLLDEGQLVRLQPRLPASRPARLDAEIVLVVACHDRRFGYQSPTHKSKITRSKYSVETSAMARARQIAHCARARKR